MLNSLFKTINGVDIYPIISLTLFFIFFIGVLIWTLRLDKNFIERMKGLPLDNTVNFLAHGEKQNDR